MSNQPTEPAKPKKKKLSPKTMPYYGKRDEHGAPLCARCGRKTYRAQAGIPICSFCEADVLITFDGVRHVVDRRTNAELEIIKTKEA